jgi:hypothetical protein
MDIPELAHLDNSYEFLKDPCFREETFFEYSLRVHRLLEGAWNECAVRNPEFKWSYFDQYAHCVLTRKRAEQSLLMVLHFAERGGMITSYQERDVRCGFCGWMGITVVKSAEFCNLLKGLHHGVADNYLRALFRRVSLVPRGRNWVKAFAGSEVFIFDETTKGT